MAVDVDVAMSAVDLSVDDMVVRRKYGEAARLWRTEKGQKVMVMDFTCPYLGMHVARNVI